MPGPFDGLCVVEFGRFIAAPGDMAVGADQNQRTFIQCGNVRIVNRDNLERHAAYLGRFRQHHKLRHDQHGCDCS